MDPVIELQNGVYLATREIADWKAEDVDVGNGLTEKRLEIIKTDGTTEFLIGKKAEAAISALRR